jgi:hypothetical protein
MEPFESAGGIMSDPFDDLPALRRKAEEGMDPAEVAQYGDELWNAALAVLGFPPTLQRN